MVLYMYIASLVGMFGLHTCGNEWNERRWHIQDGGVLGVGLGSLRWFPFLSVFFLSTQSLP